MVNLVNSIISRPLHFHLMCSTKLWLPTAKYSTHTRQQSVAGAAGRFRLEEVKDIRWHNVNLKMIRRGAFVFLYLLCYHQ